VQAIESPNIHLRLPGKLYFQQDQQEITEFLITERYWLNNITNLAKSIKMYKSRLYTLLIKLADKNPDQGKSVNIAIVLQ